MATEDTITGLSPVTTFDGCWDEVHSVSQDYSGCLLVRQWSSVQTLQEQNLASTCMTERSLCYIHRFILLLLHINARQSDTCTTTAVNVEATPESKDWCFQPSDSSWALLSRTSTDQCRCCRGRDVRRLEVHDNYQGFVVCVWMRLWLLAGEEKKKA